MNLAFSFCWLIFCCNMIDLFSHRITNCLGDRGALITALACTPKKSTLWKMFPFDMFSWEALGYRDCFGCWDREDTHSVHNEGIPTRLWHTWAFWSMALNDADGNSDTKSNDDDNFQGTCHSDLHHIPHGRYIPQCPCYTPRKCNIASKTFLRKKDTKNS